MSYRCTQNLARKISSHNAKIIHADVNGREERGGVVIVGLKAIAL